MIRVLPLYDTYIIQIREKKGIACLNKNSFCFCTIMTSLTDSSMIPDLISLQPNIVDQFTEFSVSIGKQ